MGVYVTIYFCVPLSMSAYIMHASRNRLYLSFLYSHGSYFFAGLFQCNRDPFTGAPGLHRANKRTWFWPRKSSTGLMSGRKQGFPPSLQEKRPRFDDTSECSKLSCFTAVQTEKFSSGFLETSLPSGQACGEVSLWISDIKEILQTHQFGMRDESLCQSSFRLILTTLKSHYFMLRGLLKCLCNQTTGACCHACLKRICFCCFQGKPLLQRNAPVLFIVVLQCLQKKAKSQRRGTDSCTFSQFTAVHFIVLLGFDFARLPQVSFNPRQALQFSVQT